MKPDRWPAFVAALAGFVWFLQLGGVHTLNPTNIGWILDGDWRQHWLGWLFFRHEPWTFPLGTITRLPYPVGTSIGFTDSNPLVSLALKPFSNWLPAEFQFIGPWLALCFILQGYMGARLASVVTRNAGQQMLGGCLFVLSPVLAARLGHDTLCAHWLLLGLMFLGLREYADERDARRGSWLATGAVMLAAAIHPYLTTMSYALALTGVVRFWMTGLMTRGRAALAALATTAGMFAVWGVVGYLGPSQIGSPGFGSYSSDLLSLVDPREYSRLLPALHSMPSQWEGMGFVGLGGLLAAVTAAVMIAQQRPKLPSRVKPTVIACILMAVYALSSDIRFDGTLVLHVSRVYDAIGRITSAFRASGRFIWPLHYLVLCTGLWGVSRLAGKGRQAAGTGLLAMTVLIQAADFRIDPSWAETKQFKQAPVGGFALARGHYQHMALFPMLILGACGEDFQEDYVYRYMLQAYRLNLTYNSGIFARFPKAALQAACGQMNRDVEFGVLDAQTIYVVSPTFVLRFTRAGAACGRFDGDWICVSGDSDERFRTYVTTGK